MGGKAPKVQGPSQAELDAQAAAEAKQATLDTEAQTKVSTESRAATSLRTGRRMLLAPGREDEISKLGDTGGTAF